MEITAAMVNELRKTTGAGLMDCKKALQETSGEMEKAVDFLRTKGLAAASKKAGRTATEGLVHSAVSADGKSGVLIEINSETDFVAKNDKFQAFVSDISQHILAAAPADLDTLLSQNYYKDSSKNVQTVLTEAISVIGENIQIRRFDRFQSNGKIGSYIHAGGKIGVIVDLEGDGDLNALAKDIAMHTAAASPQFVCRDEVPSDILEREKEIYRAKARETGKPDNIIEKIIIGQINKFYGEICLLEQQFVKDTDKSVQQVVKGVGPNAKIVRFARFVLGEGLEKKHCDFAAEVAAAAGTK